MFHCGDNGSIVDDGGVRVDVGDVASVDWDDFVVEEDTGDTVDVVVVGDGTSKLYKPLDSAVPNTFMVNAVSYTL